MPKISKEKKLGMLKNLITIRRFEEKTIRMYQEGEFGGYLHPYVGQEAVAAGACAAIGPEDYIISTHRGHGHCISKGADLGRMMAELLGKATGYCKGRGGSMHIADTGLKMLGANGIVGGGIPISIGAGFSCRMRGRGEVTLCFFGDGAANNGVFHEALNMAAIFKLPVVFICENNLYAISLPRKKQTASKTLAEKAEAYGFSGQLVDGNDVLAMYASTKQALDKARKGGGPSMIEAFTYRLSNHTTSDSNPDHLCIYVLHS